MEDALVLDPRANSVRIRQEVAGQVVTLRGVVLTLEAKRAAAQDARNTMGVIAVKNRLKVNPSQEQHDPEIAQAVRDALMADPVVAYKIVVDVAGGVAYLSGTVDSFFEKSEAELVASKVSGVVDVVNDIKIRSSPHPPGMIRMWTISILRTPIFLRRATGRMRRGFARMWKPGSTGILLSTWTR